jgi:hypothetical protein
MNYFRNTTSTVFLSSQPSYPQETKEKTLKCREFGGGGGGGGGGGAEDKFTESVSLGAGAPVKLVCPVRDGHL